MATNAVIAHRIPGRVRLVIRERRGDADYFADLSDRLTRFPSVQNSRVNAATGSIALEFTGSMEDILRQAEEEDLLAVIEGVKADASRQLPSRLMMAPINLVSGREINRMFMVGSLLVVVGVIQTLRGELFPPAFSVFWAASEAFRLAERPRASVGAEVGGTPATVPS
jgi:hypothetical protein